jgi:Rrf2 family protein
MGHDLRFTMLQISRRADYAVRIMLELGSLPPGQHLPAGDIALRTDVPKTFLHKIVADLVKAGLARTYKGSSGGLGLVRAAESISMLDIVEAVDGPVCLNQCLLQPAECPRDSICPAHTFWGNLQMVVLTHLREATLDRLLAELNNPERRPARSEIPYVFMGIGRDGK